MASNGKETYCVYLELEGYLRDWVIDENGGDSPILFPKLSVENRILQTYLRKTPWNALPDMPGDNTVAIAIPNFRHTDPTTYNYLPKPQKHILKNCIRNRFLINLWMDLHQFGYIGKRRDHLIIEWMQKHGIEVDDKNFNTVIKIYQRMRNAYMQRERRRKKRQNAKKCS